MQGEITTPKQKDYRMITQAEIDNLKKISINISSEIEVPKKPLLDLFGVVETKELLSAVCGTVNLVISKNGVMSYVSMIPTYLIAYTGSDQILSELLDMTPEEYINIKTHVGSELRFPANDTNFEKLVEDVTYHGLGLLVSVLQYNAKESKTEE